MYGYAIVIPLFCECCMRHGQCLKGVGNLIHHSPTSNYTPDMIRCNADIHTVHYPRQ